MAQKVEVHLEDDLDGGTGTTRARASSSDPDTAKIRVWAKENGHEVSDRGRIHQSIKDAYYVAH